MGFLDWFSNKVQDPNEIIGRIYLDKKLDYAPYRVRRISGPSFLSYGPGSGSETEIIVQYEHYVNSMPEKDHLQNLELNLSRISAECLSEKLSDERYKALCSRAPKM